MLFCQQRQKQVVTSGRLGAEVQTWMISRNNLIVRDLVITLSINDPPFPCRPDLLFQTPLPITCPHPLSLIDTSCLMSRLFLFAILCLALTAESKRIKFKDCGQKEVQWVDVEPCSKEPCTFKKNTIVHVSSQVNSRTSVAGGTLKATVLLGDVEVEYPGIEPDICKLVSCPIKSGDSFNVKMDIEVADYFPAVSALPVIPHLSQMMR